MHRNVILDFLSIYRQQLNTYSFKQASISLMGRLNLKEISSLMLRADEVITYHVNEPRIYEKTYSFEVFAQTICDMAVFTKSEIYLNKNDISSVTDPFYLKDIRNIDFVSLKIYPIIIKDEVVGTIIFYFNDHAKEFKCKNNDLVKLFENLQNTFNEPYDKIVNDSIVNAEEYNRLVYFKEKNLCYIDNFLKNKFHLKTNIVDLSNLEMKNKLERETKNKKYRFTKSDNFDIYYISKYDYKYDDNNFDLLALTTLNNNSFPEFSLIYVDNQNIDLLLANMFSNNIIKKYHVQNNLNVYLLDLEISNASGKEILTKIVDNYALIITSKTITSKMKLESLSYFIAETRPEKFVFSSYVEYLNNINQSQLYANVEVSKALDKTFVNSITNEKYGVLPSLMNFDVYTKTQRDNLIKAIYNFINSLVKNTMEGYIIPVLPSMLSTSRFFSAIKRLQEIDRNLKVIITVPSIEKDNINGLEKGISKLRKEGVYVVVDSSIYFNNQTLYLLDLCNSIYIHKEEYEMLVKYPSGINTAIFQYMIKNYKELLIDYPLSKVTDAYFNTLLYYLK